MTYGTGGKQLLCLGINHRTYALASDLDDAIVRAGGFDHLRTIGIQMDHRLLAIHIFARLHRIHRDLLVPMVGGSDDDGVNVFALQDLGVVTSGKNIVAPEFFAVLKPAVITIGHGNKLHPGNLHRDLGISLTLATRTDQCELNMVVGCYWLAWFRLGLGQQMRSRTQECFHGCGRPGRFKKVSTIQIEHSRPHS